LRRAEDNHAVVADGVVTQVGHAEGLAFRACNLAADISASSSSNRWAASRRAPRQSTVPRRVRFADQAVGFAGQEAERDAVQGLSRAEALRDGTGGERDYAQLPRDA